MLDAIQTLMRRTEQTEREKRKTQMQLIQAQVKPHFLYNVLGIISGFLNDGETQLGNRAIDSLASFYRISLSDGSDVIPLSREVALVENYLTLQQLRYVDMIDYEIDIDESLEQACVPKLTLQPLVENAIDHGIRNTGRGGFIRISGREEDGFCVLTVCDDGAGMAGMPHFERCVFTGEFPVARLDFSDRHFPGAVRLTAFNPFIPTNADDSSLPAAFFTVRLENDTAEPLTYTVAFSACNFFAKNSGIHRLRREGEQTYLVLANPEKEDSFDRGDLTLATDADDCCGQEYWFRGNWFDSLSVFWQDFTAPWPLRERRYGTNAETVNVMPTLSASRTRFCPSCNGS